MKWDVWKSTPVVDQINHDFYSWNHCVTHTFLMNKQMGIMQKEGLSICQNKGNMDEANQKNHKNSSSGGYGGHLERGSVRSEGFEECQEGWKLKRGYKGERDERKSLTR